MDKLTDPNPYDVLDITPDANHATIKSALAEKQRISKTQLDRQQARNARQTLSLTAKRLIVDALMPDFIGAHATEGIQIELGQNVSVDWREVANPDKVLQHDIQALMLATLMHNIGSIPEPEGKIELIDDFDGLDEFIEEWLK